MEVSTKRDLGTPSTRSELILGFARREVHTPLHPPLTSPVVP
jgi:hypothetical protein